MSGVPILADEGGHDIAVVSVFACHIFQRIVTSAGQGVCSTDPNAAIPPMPVVLGFPGEGGEIAGLTGLHYITFQIFS